MFFYACDVWRTEIGRFLTFVHSEIASLDTIFTAQNTSVPAALRVLVPWCSLCLLRLFLAAGGGGEDAKSSARSAMFIGCQGPHPPFLFFSGAATWCWWYHIAGRAAEKQKE